MSYGNPDLEEIPFEQLEAEILRRRTSFAAGICPYCKKPIPQHTCKFVGNLEVLGGPKKPANILCIGGGQGIDACGKTIKEVHKGHARCPNGHDYYY